MSACLCSGLSSETCPRIPARLFQGQSGISSRLLRHYIVEPQNGQPARTLKHRTQPLHCNRSTEEERNSLKVTQPGQSRLQAGMSESHPGHVPLQHWSLDRLAGKRLYLVTFLSPSLPPQIHHDYQNKSWWKSSKGHPLWSVFKNYKGLPGVHMWVIETWEPQPYLAQCPVGCFGPGTQDKRAPGPFWLQKPGNIGAQIFLFLLECLVFLTSCWSFYDTFILL